MAITDAGHGVVNVGGCRCPGTPHGPAGDTVTLAPAITIPMGVAAQQAMHDVVTDPGAMKASVASMAGALSSVYLTFGIIGWSFVDEKRELVPVTPEATARLLPWGNGGMEVAEEADRLYGAELLAPFLRRQQRLSQPGLTDGLTSANPASGPQLLTRSKRSSHSERAGKRSAVRAR